MVIAYFNGDFNVFKRGKVRHQIIELKDKTYVATSIIGQLLFVE